MKVGPQVADLSAQAEMRAAASSTDVLGPRAKHAASVLLIVIAIVALFWRVFFLGETLIDVNTLNNQLPWGYSAGQSDYPYNRRDLTDTYVTRDYFVAAAYQAGEFPLWNPYTMAGHPIYADGVTRTLSPFLLFYKFFDIPLGYSIARITELMLAAVLMYIFLIAIRASANGALMGSLVFSFSAHSMLHLTGLGWWGGLMWLPLIALFVDRAIRRQSFVQALLAGVCLAAQFFCGYLPNQIYYVGAIVLYYAFFSFIGRKRSAVGRNLAMMVVTLVAGFALSATQWVPALELLSNSNRKIVGAELGYIYLPPWYAVTLVFPNLFGTAYDAKFLTLFTAVGVSHDHILYIGIAALLPLGFSLWWLKSTRQNRKNAQAPVENFAPDAVAAPDREAESLGNHHRPIALVGSSLGDSVHDRANFFVCLAGLSLIIMMAAPLYVPVTRFIPILQVIRVAVRAGVLFLFSAAVLAAFGTDLLLAADSEALRRYGKLARKFALWIVAFVLLAVIGSYLIKLTGFAVDTGERGSLAFVRRAASALSVQFTPPNLSILIALGLLPVSVVLVWALAEKRLTRARFFACLVLLLMADLFWNSSQFDHSFDRSRVFPKTEITERLHSLPPGRVLVVPSGLESNRRVSRNAGEKIIAPPNTLLPYQISTVTGKNQQFPKWYREFASLVEPQNNLSHIVFDEYRSPYLDLLNVRYVMTHESASLPGYDLLATSEGVSLYENDNALPRAFFVSNVVDASSHEEAIGVLQSAHFKPDTTAIIENAGPSFAAVTHRADELETAINKPSSGAARIAEDKRNRVVIETDNQKAEPLVVSDNYYPGWSAFVDGAPATIYRTNCTMRAVAVPAGRHLVSFVFMPATFLGSMYVSLAAAALTLVVLILSALKRRQR